MAEPEQKLTSPVSLVVDAILVIGFFLYMFWVMQSHVPSQDPKMINLWAAITASLMAALFWLSLQMFRVVLRFQRQERAAGKK